MRKIVDFYYISYPNNNPDDPSVASSEVYVEVGNEHSTPDHFEATYALRVCTLGFLQAVVSKSGSYVPDLPTIVVKHFDDTTIRRVLESILDRIDSLAVKKGR